MKHDSNKNHALQCHHAIGSTHLLARPIPCHITDTQKSAIACHRRCEPIFRTRLREEAEAWMKTSKTSETLHLTVEWHHYR